jgi:biopolymer transport protein ExbB/TolQ
VEDKYFELFIIVMIILSSISLVTWTYYYFSIEEIYNLKGNLEIKTKNLKKIKMKF